MYNTYRNWVHEYMCTYTCMCTDIHRGMQAQLHVHVMYRLVLLPMPCTRKRSCWICTVRHLRLVLSKVSAVSIAQGSFYLSRHRPRHIDMHVQVLQRLIVKQPQVDFRGTASIDESQSETAAMWGLNHSTRVESSGRHKGYRYA